MVYILLKENFEEETYVEVYSTKEKAMYALEEIKKKYCKYDYYLDNGTACEWFDAEFNEFSTYVSIEEHKVM